MEETPLDAYSQGVVEDGYRGEQEVEHNGYRAGKLMRDQLAPHLPGIEFHAETLGRDAARLEAVRQ